MTGAGMARIPLDDGTATIDRYVVFDPDRHGKPRYYFRRKGQKKVRLRAEPGTQAFMDEFRAACEGTHPAQLPKTPQRKGARPRPPAAPRTPDSLAWLFAEYLRRDRELKDGCETTRKRRAVVIDEICAEPVSESDNTPIGSLPYATLRPRVVRVVCDRSPTPATANARLKAFRQAFRFAIDDEMIEINPARDASYRHDPSEGYHTWSVEEVEQFHRRHPLGTTPRLAVDLLLFSGQRRSDVVLLGKQHRQGSGWKLTQFKGRNKSPVTMWIPILPILQASIDACPSKGLTYLETRAGNPFTAKGFGGRMKVWCNQADLSPDCTAHGLRKAGATIAAENGATVHHLMSIFGWKKMAQAEIYTKKAEQKRLAMASMHMLIPSNNDPTEANGTS